MITTPSMGLKRWDQPNDIFSYTELSDNWAAIDSHDHTTGKGVQVPTGGLANLAVTEPKIANDAITVNKLATDAVTAAKIAANAVTTGKVLDANVTDAKLASPNNGVWRALADWTFEVGASLAAGDYVTSIDGSLTANSSNVASPVKMIPLDSTAYAVAGKTTKLRLLVAGACNVSPPGVNFSFGLSHLNAPGGVSGSVIIGAFTPVTGSLLTINTPSASQDITAATSAFDMPSTNERYTIRFTTSGTTGTNSTSFWTVCLQVAHV